MDNYLKQKCLLKQKEFEISEKGLVVRTKDFTEYVEITVPYEDITQNSSILKSSSKGWFIAGTVFLVIIIINIILQLTGEDVDKSGLVVLTVFAAICYGIYVLQYQSVKKLMLADGSAIIFFLNKPNIKIFNGFIESLFIKRKEYLKKKYTKIDVDLPPEQQLYRMNWLKEEEIIDEKEYKELKTLIIEGNKSSSFGFQMQQESM